MTAVKIIPDIYWAGAVDWNMRHFHGHTYTTKRGTTYNAYLIIDKKVALVDTVYKPFAREMMGKNLHRKLKGRGSNYGKI